jgi:hypothetical protein
MRNEEGFKEPSFIVIEAGHYEETRQRLTKDPIVIAMANELKGKVPRSELVHNDDPNDPRPTPRFDFMMKANAEYRDRGGTDGGHMGAIAEAILRLI